MVKIYIDKKAFFVKKSNNVLQACLSVGISVPFFCWHPALGSIGSCRQCAVKIFYNEKDELGSIVMSCMTGVTEGIRISVIDPDVKKFQKSIIELMMLNHPHDCPICSEGGNCHLQDMTVLNQHHIRRYRFTKRIFKNQYLGPFISHVMNRCITCYRCLRYYTDYAGGRDLGVYSSSNKIYFGRLEDGLLESEYSGNLVDVCPTGVFTDKSNVQNFHRKWDLQYSPSICHGCSIGCNINLGERLGKLCRIDNRYNKKINKYFLCDLGRFGSNYVNTISISSPFVKKNNKIKFLNYSDSVKCVSTIFQNSFNKILGIGSSRASVESNMALYHLVGKKNFSNGMLPELDECMKLIVDIIKNGGIHIPSITEIEKYDVILIIGEDITQTASLAALSVRQAVRGIYSHISKNKNIPLWHINAIKNVAQDQQNSLFIINGSETKLDEISNLCYFGSIEQQLHFSTLILDSLNDSINITKKDKKSIFVKIDFITKALCNSKKPLIISGTSYNNIDFIKVSFNIAQSLQKKGLPVGLALFPPSVNSIGVSLIPSITLDCMLNMIYLERIDILVILENDLYRLYESSFIDNIFKNVNKIIVLDHQNNRTVMRSNIFLPCTNFSESSGNVVNYEARLQRFFQINNPSLYRKKLCKLESWRWIHAISNKIYSFSSIISFTIDKMMKLCSLWNPIFKKIRDSAPSADFRIKGQKIARSPIRFSGRAAMFAEKDIHEQKSPIDLDSMFSFSMEGSLQTEKNFSYSPFLWSPNWNSNQSLYKSSITGNKFNKIYEGVLLFENYKKKIFSHFSINKFVLNDKRDYSFFKIIPYYKLLGSEEMSQNYFINIVNMNFIHAKLNYLDAEKIQIKNGDILQFQINNTFFRFPVQLSEKIVLSHIGLPLGCNGLPIIFLNKFARNLTKYNK
ncbi:NADH-quinone oxidoreductase subunit G [Buchnera aphidicola (Cinara piceae)]|uniref:NADH-quinone oxidoreductase subunit G n=1 Tax=Buchnera aphidicola (Cinara piceae) TaxID=1660043 RepID=A0A803FTL0_9GAMM|nr:NADH-quinone oxidoreductase subunit NuoG [Buchnera aphidicola]VFP88050.1 NADH-quinone oxidoreductase subunit G [Buchnera aphidicola (Cinara piceae)]